MKLDCSFVDVTVVVDDNYNFLVAEGMWAYPIKDCMDRRNMDSWFHATNDQVCTMDGLTFHETSWQPGAYEVMEVKKEDWDEFQNTRR